jgi:hypothetical protein
MSASKPQQEKNDRNSTALSQYQTQIETAALVSSPILLLFISSPLNSCFFYFDHDPFFVSDPSLSNPYNNPLYS